MNATKLIALSSQRNQQRWSTNVAIHWNIIQLLCTLLLNNAAYSSRIELSKWNLHAVFSLKFSIYYFVILEYKVKSNKQTIVFCVSPSNHHGYLFLIILSSYSYYFCLWLCTEYNLQVLGCLLVVNHVFTPSIQPSKLVLMTYLVRSYTKT